MAPETAVNSIPNLLISATDRGSQDHQSLLACYKQFNQYLTEAEVQKPVVLLSDGHSSRFYYEVLRYLKDNDIMFISPPDTTGVTQLLDKINQLLHLKYKNEKERLFTSMSTLNREAFMIILGEIWSTWAPPDSITNAAKRVGITDLGLSVEHMQKDKFSQAENCIQAEPISPQQPATATGLTIESPDHRKSSALYWKAKFEKAAILVHELNEKTLDLEKVPGLLTVKNVKPKMSKKSNKVTNIHGSIMGKGILELSREIEDGKKRKQAAKEDRKKNKEEQKQAFLRCKDECMCKTRTCHAINLKQCSICHDILKSMCTKIACKGNDGSKPKMIQPAAAGASKTKVKRRRLFREESFSCSSSEDDDEDNDDEDIESEDEDDEKDEPMEVVPTVEERGHQNYIATAVVKKLHAVWKQLSPPTKEDKIVGKWYAVIYQNRKSPMLYIGKAVRRFLHDKNGPVGSILIRCLKPKVGSGTVLEYTPAHQPPDESSFLLSEIIDGPLLVTPKGSKIFHKFHNMTKFRNILDKL